MADKPSRFRYYTPFTLYSAHNITRWPSNLVDCMSWRCKWGNHSHFLEVLWELLLLRVQLSHIRSERRKNMRANTRRHKRTVVITNRPYLLSRLFARRGTYFTPVPVGCCLLSIPFSPLPPPDSSFPFIAPPAPPVSRRFSRGRVLLSHGPGFGLRLVQGRGIGCRPLPSSLPFDSRPLCL